MTRGRPQGTGRSRTWTGRAPPGRVQYDSRSADPTRKRKEPTMAVRTFAPLIALTAAAVSTMLAGAAPAVRPVPAADSYMIDPVHSSVIFRIKHLNTTNFYGQFNKVTGTINYDEANPSACSLEAEIPVESIDTHNGKRDSDVKGPDMFNAAKFPTISFKSTSFSRSGDNAFEVAGDLTMHGVTKPVSVRLEKTGAGKGMSGKDIIGFEATFNVKRSDFGMTFMPGGLGEDVRLIVSTEAGKK